MEEPESKGKSAFLRYVDDVDHIEALTSDQQKELVQVLRTGTEEERAEAKQQLIMSNLKLVIMHARAFVGAGLPLDELIAEGNFGLVQAANKFDPSRGVLFSTCATVYILNAICNALSSKSRTVRLPKVTAERLCKLRKAKRQLTEKLGREPLVVELAKALDWPESRVGYLMIAEIFPCSLDAPLDAANPEKGVFGDLVADDAALFSLSQVERADMKKQFRKCLRSLTKREQLVLRMRYGLGGERKHTLEEISLEIGRSRELVRHVQIRAIEKLGEKMRQWREEVF